MDLNWYYLTLCTLGRGWQGQRLHSLREGVTGQRLRSLGDGGDRGKDCVPLGGGGRGTDCSPWDVGLRQDCMADHQSKNIVFGGEPGQEEASEGEICCVGCHKKVKISLEWKLSINENVS